jgi:lysophospholipase L1-like esterase
MKFNILALMVSAATAATVPQNRVRAAEPSWRFVGRVNPATKELTWPSTGVAFSFEGTTASINIADLRGTASATLYIDDNEPIVISNVNGTSITTPVLSQGVHSVELRKRSETNFGTFRVEDVTTDGAFVEPETPVTRRIEIIGDSISVGYGLDGVLPCTDSAALQNNPKTYGAVAARALGADYSVVAWSGKGLIRNYASNPPDTSPPMPQLYTRYGANDADGSFTFPPDWVPDAVVINLGTNDFSYLDVRDPVDPDELLDALLKLIRSIHEHYPEAEFFLMSSPLLNDNWPAGQNQKSTHAAVLQDAIKNVCGGIKAHFVDWPSQGAEVGCDYHPVASTNLIGAGLLEESIREALGW